MQIKNWGLQRFSLIPKLYISYWLSLIEPKPLYFHRVQWVQRTLHPLYSMTNLMNAESSFSSLWWDRCILIIMILIEIYTLHQA